MKKKELKLIYFSPTGTTRRVMMEIAKAIDLKSVSFDFSVHKEKKPSLAFSSGDFAVFGIPVYAGRVPRIFLEYLDGIRGDHTPAALVATYGCRAYEDALLELKNEVEARGFHVIGAAAIPTEHSIVRSIGLGRPNQADRKTIADFAVRLNRRLKEGTSPEQITVDVPGNSPYRKYSPAGLYPKADPKLCTECGSCAKVCPAGAIPLKDPKKTNHKKCISCQKCVRLCPQKARSVNSLKLNALTKKLTKICQSDKEAEFFL